jgi:hypothetical protein
MRGLAITLLKCIFLMNFDVDLYVPSCFIPAVMVMVTYLKKLKLCLEVGILCS